jgi:hypothetical protein
VPARFAPSTLLPKVRQTVAQLAEAYRVQGYLISGAECDAADVEIYRLQAELRALEDQIPP